MDTSDELIISITRDRPRFTIACFGRLESEASGKLRHAVESCLDKRPASVHIDLEGVSLIGGSAADALIDVARRCQDLNVTLELTLGDEASRRLNDHGLDELLNRGVALRCVGASSEAATEAATGTRRPRDLQRHRADARLRTATDWRAPAL